MGYTISKTILLTVCLFLAITATVNAKTVNLAWDPSPSTTVAGYKIYYKEGSSSLNFNGTGANEGSSPIDVGTNLSSSLTGLPDTQTHSFAVTAYDTSGNESTPSNIVESSPVIIAINHPPVLTAIGSKTINEGINLSFTLSATDPDGDSLTYRATGLPNGATFNAATQTFTWTPGSNQAGSYNVSFSVSDGSLNDAETVAINVGNVNRPPVLTAIGSKTINEGTNLGFTLSATDPDGDSLTYSATSLPSGATFNAATRTFSWTPGSNQAGSYNVSFSVSDGSLNDSETVAISVGNVNRPPVLTAIGSKTINEGTNLGFTLSATDPDGDSLTYRATGLPNGATFNAATQTFSWTPGSDQAGSYNVSFSVSDGSLNDSETVAISVGNVNRPPVLTAIGSKTINVGTNLSVTLSATDLDGDSLTYRATGLPSGATFNAATRTFSWTPGSDQAGSYNVSFSVSDGSLNDSETVAISVGNVNRPPVLTAIGSKTINVETNLSFTLSAMDPDGDSLTYRATGLPNGATFNAATRLFTWTPGNTQVGNYNVSFSVSDGSLNDAETVSISVGSVNRPPVLTAIGSKTINVEANLSFTLNATDPDGDDLTYSATDLPSGATFNAATRMFNWTPGNTQAGSYNMSFSVSDGSLNDAETVAISVDASVPVGLSLPLSENGLPGVEREDGGDDSNNYVNGMPKGDVKYIFRVVLRDTSGGELPSVILILNGYAYPMVREVGDIETGATFSFTTRLGPVASHRFYFQARDAEGKILSEFPAQEDLQGPQVEFLNGKNMIGARGNINPLQLSSTDAIGSTQSFRWIPSEKKNGSYVRVDNSGPVILGEGYVIKRTTDSFLPSMEQLGENPALTSKIPVKTGWNLIANPYGGNVPLSKVLIQDGDSEPISWVEAVSRRMIVDGSYYYAGRDWGGDTVFESSDGEQGAILIPGIGYWIYVNSENESLSLVIPKPQQ